MKSIKSKLLLAILGVSVSLSVILFIVVMVLLSTQKKNLSLLAEEQEKTIVAETTGTMMEYEKWVAQDFADASVKYFGNVFSSVRKHAASIAARAASLYRENDAVTELDSKVGIVKDADMDEVRKDFAVIAPIRDFIAYLPDYDVSKLSELDLYLVTETGMCLDGTYDELGNDYADLRNETWYEEVKSSGEMYWSGIFTGKVTGKVKVVCAAPVFDQNGKLRGVASGDIAVESFQNILENYNEEQIVSVVFFDKNGELMYATNGYDGNDKVSALLNSGVNYATEGENIFTFRKMDETGWTICLVMSAEKILSAVDTVQANIGKNAEENKAVVQNGINGNIIAFCIIVAIAVIAIIGVTSAISSHFVKPIRTLMGQVAVVGEGNLDASIEATTNDEIGKLAEAFNKMTVDLKGYMTNLENVTREKERIGAELDIATHIQSSMLPMIFPPYPDRTEFDIVASMDPAKEVGGDFYDFFMIDDRHVAIVMADVSGKGVPAALFMVIGKTLIKDHTTPGRDLTEVFYEVNNLLCEANSEDLFITAFEGVLDLVTGNFMYVNAGHETPFFRQPGGVFEPHPVEASFVLAGIDDMEFKGGNLTLEPGSRVFLYTDGVPESTNAHDELFDMERLGETLVRVSDMPLMQILPAIRADVDKFVGEAPQFDDLTMLCLEYKARMEV